MENAAKIGCTLYMTDIELVNIICPEHNPVYDTSSEPSRERTQCSDESLTNGFYTLHLKGHPRCSRCALLQLLSGVPMPDGFQAFPGGIEFDWD